MENPNNKEESLDDQLRVSCSYILNGRIGDIKRLRQVIFDFLGAEMSPDGHIHQATPSTSIRLIYHTLSQSRLFVVKEEVWKKIGDHPAR